MTDIITYVAGSFIALCGVSGIYGNVTNMNELEVTDAAMNVGELWFGGNLVGCGQNDMNIISAVPEAIKNMAMLPYNLITGNRYEQTSAK